MGLAGVGDIDAVGESQLAIEVERARFQRESPSSSRSSLSAGTAPLSPASMHGESASRCRSP